MPRLLETAQRVLAVAGRRAKYGDGGAQDDEMGVARGDGAWPPAVQAALQVGWWMCVYVWTTRVD